MWEERDVMEGGEREGESGWVEGERVSVWRWKERGKERERRGGEGGLVVGVGGW